MEEDSREEAGCSNVFSVRIVSIDYYMAPPVPGVDVCYSSFHGEKVNEVPVIRIYGSTPAGKKTCLHVHQVFPYLYVPCSDIPLDGDLKGDAYTHAISLAMEKALKLKAKASVKRQHVHGCNLVRARRFYGYHVAEELFVRIYLYDPHDIARAAKLLLGGVVFDQSVQPHESHIPYLLQFLVDYHLYGMGHIHLQKIKFRLPLLDAFLQEKLNEGIEQADSVCAVRGQTPSQTSPMVPGDQIWESASDSDALMQEIFQGVKRQSTCELEGDAVVHDIVNQNYKLYTSLSQARLDVKMVQSLVPIWEEELERSGMHDVSLHPDPGKPSPEDVLKVLSFGLDLEGKLVEFYAVAKQTSSSLEQNLDHISPKTSSGLPFEKTVASTLDEDRDPCKELLPAENGLSTMTEMRTDKEAIGLLKWLASSQAADEINSDDELIQEIILSPLLPANDINKMLEKANMDYESESQKECQDILDTIAATVSAGSKDVSNHNHMTPEKRIPQMDGSRDDIGSSCNMKLAGSLLSTSEKSKNKQSAPDLSLHSIANSSVKKQGSRRLLWGDLPFSLLSADTDDCKLKSSITDHCCLSDTKDVNMAICPSHGRQSLEKVENVVQHLQEGSELRTCSLREMMRRKRNLHFAPSAYGGEKDYALFYSEDYDSLNCDESDMAKHVWSERKTNSSYPYNQSVGFYNCLEDVKALNLSSEGSLIKVRTDVPEQCGSSAEFVLGAPEPSATDSKKGEGFSICRKPVDDPGVKSKEVTSGSAETSQHVDCPTQPALWQNVKCKSSSKEEMPWRALGNEAAKDNLSKDYFNHNDQDELGEADLIRTTHLGPTYSREIGKPFSLDTNVSEKPCTARSEGAAFKNAPCIEAEKDCVHLAQGDCGDEGDSDGVQPFFRQPRDENKQIQHDDSVVADYFHQKYAAGVPVHYLNDGSHLFLLTPGTSPPAADIVEKWLLCNDGVGPRNSEMLASPNASPGNSSGCRPEADCKLNEVCLENSTKHRQELYNEAVGQASSQLKSSDDSLQDISQISGPVRKSRSTPLSQLGFRDPASAGAGQQLTLLSIEVLAESRGDLQSDPRFDSINILALAISNDSDSAMESYALICSDSQSPQRNRDGLYGCKVIEFTEEKHLVVHFMELVSRYDPDILIGWDVQGGSLGFLTERAAFLGIGLLNKISRVPTENKDGGGELIPDDCDELLKYRMSEALKANSILSKDAFVEDEWGRTHASGVHVGGRIVLNGWRLMRGEVKLNMYCMEAVADAVLRRKVPSFPPSVLTKWFHSGPERARYRCLEHIVERAKLNLQIIEQLDLINRTSELARVFGIDFFSVLSRGSQYRVESMLLRLAHTQNYIAISPGNEQVAFQPAMECLPLVMEPESGFYVDPVVVLDFQSLYPSMIIAYNLCFCTCLGKIAPSKQNILGVSTFSPDAHVIHRLRDELLLTPNGVMYVPPTVRKGILPCLLEEILSTRIMVKRAMKKLTPAQRVLFRIFNARQLALKLIANVAYGYAAAGFSGRMPCAELADSIVQCGRRTLENAISFVNSHDKWKAKVVYGDTDSMFVLLKGRTVNEAFKIGQEIADVISGMNPNPVVLKMEKVYQPCFLLTKKRYVGYSYENPEQTPLFDAKGIETVRRDTCAAVTKTMEQSLRLYFDNQDIGKVKAYLCRQWGRILSGRISLQDFVFAKEVRLGTYSTRQSVSLPPAAIVATKAMRKDPRAEPRYGERIPYVVVHGEPGSRLVDMVVDPMEVLRIDSPLRLNELYYISKQIIPSLQRVFGLVGVDLNIWFAEMPRPMREIVKKHSFSSPNTKRTRIDYYYLSNHCIICGDLVPSSVHICNKCSCNSSAVASYVTGKTSRLEGEMHHLAAICRHCGGGDWIVGSGVKCTSLACPVFYERRKVQKELRGFSAVAADEGFYPKCIVDWF